MFSLKISGLESFLGEKKKKKKKKTMVTVAQACNPRNDEMSFFLVGKVT